MRRILFAFLAATLLAIPSATTAPVSAATCQFVLGFKAIHDAIPDRVGNCLVDEHHNPVNGDGLQETTAWHGKGGLLVWRKADNWTAFTDGSTTWVNGPNGLQQRSNDQRFAWEADAAGHQIVQPQTRTQTTTTTTQPSIDWPAGSSALCSDGTFSFSANRRGTCSWHGGVAVWR
jgi:hypothetical protein